MAGQFSKSNRPQRPGGYVNFVAVVAAAVPPNIGDIVAIPFVHDWGPSESAVLVGSLADFQNAFGSSTTTPAYTAVSQAFRGEDVPGFGGAGSVLCYRMSGSSAAKATITLTNTAGATAAITLTAIYEGVRGNALRATVQDKAGDSTKDTLILLDGTQIIESYDYTDTDIAGLAAQINQTSEWMKASLLVNGTGLTRVANAPFANGDNGATLVSADWTNMMNALTIERFSAFAPFDLTDSSILVTVQTWQAQLNTSGKRFFTVIGGALNETLSTALTRSSTINDPNVVNIGVGSVRDDTLGLQLSTSQLAPRIAGIIAARGDVMSLTFARLGNVSSIVSGVQDAQVVQAFDGGVLVLTRDSNVTAPVRIEEAVTTYTTTSDSTRPYVIYRNPKYLRTMQLLELDLTEWSEENVVGKLAVNNATRDFVLGHVRAYLVAREKGGTVQSGWTAIVDPNPPASDDDSFVAIAVGLKFGRSAEQIYFTVSVG